MRAIWFISSFAAANFWAWVLAEWKPRVEKRATPLKSGKGNADTHLWPNGVIRYCFENSDSKMKLFNDLETARNYWYESGLQQEMFKFEEVSDAECQDNRANVLLIKYSAPGTGPGQSQMSTTVGIPPHTDSYANDGPVMILSDDESLGMLDKVSNYAHELGHAWGLYHEHQNPYYWETSYGGKGDAEGSRFGSSSFNCQALKDYSIVMDKIQKRIEKDPSGGHERDRALVCQIRAKANQYQFSAANYLPLTIQECAPIITDPRDVDWDSIMIYPSHVDSDQNGAPVLKKPNGDLIGKNLHPSSRDVSALSLMYQDAKLQDGPLLNDKKNKKYNIFKRLACKIRDGSDDVDECDANQKRANNWIRQGEYKNTMISSTCNQGTKTIEKWIITSLKYSNNPKPITTSATCIAIWDQACHHYSSAIKVNPAWATITCPEAAATAQHRLDGKATDVWSTQHSGQGWQDKQYRKEQVCERDEYPPAYFMDEDSEAWKQGGKDDKGQLVRWLPGKMNGRAATMWKGACFKPVLEQINDRDLLNEATNNGFDAETASMQKVQNGKTTSTTTYKVAITVEHRAEFTIAEWKHDQNAPEDGLLKNECWPSDIAKQDPGFVLLDYDPYNVDKWGKDNANRPYKYKEPYEKGKNGD